MNAKDALKMTEDNNYDFEQRILNGYKKDLIKDLEKDVADAIRKGDTEIEHFLVSGFELKQQDEEFYYKVKKYFNDKGYYFDIGHSICDIRYVVLRWDRDYRERDKTGDGLIVLNIFLAIFAILLIAIKFSI